LRRKKELRIYGDEMRRTIKREENTEKKKKVKLGVEE
jgi:hypothetical protein